MRGNIPQVIKALFIHQLMHITVYIKIYILMHILI